MIAALVHACKRISLLLFHVEPPPLLHRVIHSTRTPPHTYHNEQCISLVFLCVHMTYFCAIFLQSQTGRLKKERNQVSLKNELIGVIMPNYIYASQSLFLLLPTNEKTKNGKGTRRSSERKRSTNQSKL